MKKAKVISVVFTNQTGTYEADYVLKFKKNKKGETEGTLIVPYIDWISSENCTLEYRVLTIKDRELECIEKYFFDENQFTIPIRDYPYAIEMCDILYSVIPPKIYIQMVSGTFTINKDADPEAYASFFQREKENKSAIRQFIREQKKIGLQIKPKTILYAKKLASSSSTGDNISVILVDKLSKNDKYKVQIYLTNSASEKKQIFREGEFDDIYIAKKFFDNFEYKDKVLLTDKNRFNSLIADFTRNHLKNETMMYSPASDDDSVKKGEDIVPKIKGIFEEQLSPEAAGNLSDVFTRVLFEDKEDKC